jgi:hypothetical protein
LTSPINKKQDTQFGIPVGYYTQLLFVADAGLNVQLIKTEKLEKFSSK